MSRTTRFSRLFGSWVGVGIGISLLIRADLGVAPFDVLTTGVHHTVGWSLGLSFILVSIVFFAIGAALGGKLGWACLVGTVAIGQIVNLLLPHVPELHALVPRIAVWALAVAIIGVSVCLVITTEFGPGPSEVLMLGLVHRGMGIVPARWISDGTPVLLGALIGGSLGPGTVVFALALGPMVKFGLRRLHYTPH
ncbi:MAG: hypothetical protein ABMA25_05085 [Ilumatobacteraceae bacterium]